MSAIGTAHPVIGATTPYLPGIDPMFEAFATPTVHGLAAVSGERLDLLAVAATNPGHGDFGRFLRECMKAYRTIGIWEIWNGSLAGMLQRYGFREVREVLDGDLVSGMRWDKAGAA